MAQFAVIDENDVVTNVLVIADADCLDGDGNESESVGQAFCTTLWGSGNYVQTSYNSTFRKQFAHMGGTFDATKNKFINMKPHASWALDGNDDWMPPVALPDDAKENIGADGKNYMWNEVDYQADNANGWEDFGV